MSETQLLPISNCDRPDYEGDIIFVHGLGGDARGAWHPDGKRNNDDFWPVWLGEDLPSLRVWSLDYDIEPFRWKGQTMPLVDRATDVLSCLDLEVGDRPIFFIVHSMGGLLVKQMLRHAWDFGDPRWKAIVEQTKGIIYISTPHSGSDVANWMSYIGKILQTSVSVDELKAHDPRLRELNQVYRNHEFLQQIPIEVYCEKYKTKGALVVNETSADPGIQGVIPIPMDDDHLSICRPKSKQSKLYKRTKRFITDHLKSDPLQPLPELKEKLEKDPVEVESDREKKKIPQNIPRSRIARFVGRSEELVTLHQQLQQGDRVAISAISGMSGVGKTELAIQYAKSYYEKYYRGGVCWLPSRDGGSGVVNFALEKFELESPDKLPLENKVHYCWDNWPIQGDILVIFDDVTDYNQIKPFLPPDKPRFKVIITTQLQTLNRDLKQIKQLELNILEQDSALELLRFFLDERRFSSELEIARELCKWLGYLPLGLEIVGQYLKESPQIKLKAMKVHLEQEGLSSVEGAIEMTEKGCNKIFELPWESLETAIQEFAIQLSLFAETPIPWKIVEKYQENSNLILLNEWRIKLVKRSLLRQESENSYKFHRLLRQFITTKGYHHPKINKWKQRYCYLITSICKNILESTTLEYQNSVSLLPHILECEKHHSEYLDNKEIANIYSTLGYIYRDIGNYNKAIGFHKKSLEIRKKEFGKRHSKVAESLNNLGLAVKSSGKYDEAELYYNDSLEIREEILDSNHPDIAESCNNLAMLYTSQGKYSEAYKLYKRALKIRKEVLGNEHPKTITTLNNLASCYYEEENYIKAESIYTQLIPPAKNLFGEKNSDFIDILNNLSQVYSGLEKHEQAKNLMEECIKIQTKICTGDSQKIAIFLNNLGTIYDDLKDFKNAESYHQKALDMKRRMFGNEHVDVAFSLNNLAKLYQHIKKLKQSEQLYLEALDIAENILGIKHTVTQKIQSNLEELRSSFQDH